MIYKGEVEIILCTAVCIFFFPTENLFVTSHR